MTDTEVAARGSRLEGHGGDLALAVLRGYGVEELFTLSGGHVFPLYDAAHTSGVRIVDVRHEQTAVFGAEGIAKLTRRPGFAVLTAGPGVTNGISGITSAYFNGAPVVVLGGRAPQFRWGAGSLQEIDHIPIVSTITKSATTSTEVGAIASDVDAAVRAALSPHRGPSFIDVPMDVLFQRAEVTLPGREVPALLEPDPDDVARAAELIATAQRPVIIAGSDVYAEDAAAELVAVAETLGVPVITNGQGRGTVPADHPLSVRRARKPATSQADVVVVVGTPLDFRLGFGDFGAAKVIHIVDSPAQRPSHVTAEVSPAGSLRLILAGIANYTGPRTDHSGWVAELAAAEKAGREKEATALAADGDPLPPSRIFGELRRVLERDTVLIGDGGDFVSYAGKYLDSYEQGRWLDPGPYGCLGTGAGYALAARLTYPSSQVVLLLGDGAAGFSLMDAETLVRQKLPVVMICGNNGIWGLEKQPMKLLYGYDVAADLQPELKYDEIVKALGGAGETVSKAVDLGPALKRAFDSGVPYLVNVLTDPADVYPRSAILA